MREYCFTNGNRTHFSTVHAYYWLVISDKTHVLVKSQAIIVIHALDEPSGRMKTRHFQNKANICMPSTLQMIPESARKAMKQSKRVTQHTYHCWLVRFMLHLEAPRFQVIHHFVVGIAHVHALKIPTSKHINHKCFTIPVVTRSLLWKRKVFSVQLNFGEKCHWNQSLFPQSAECYTHHRHTLLVLAFLFSHHWFST